MVVVAQVNNGVFTPASGPAAKGFAINRRRRTVVRAADSSGRGSSSESSSSSSSTVPVKYRHSHRSKRVRIADQRLLQSQTYLEFTDKLSFTLLSFKITKIKRGQYIRVRVLRQEERSRCYVVDVTTIMRLSCTVRRSTIYRVYSHILRRSTCSRCLLCAVLTPPCGSWPIEQGTDTRILRAR